MKIQETFDKIWRTIWCVGLMLFGMFWLPFLFEFHWPIIEFDRRQNILFLVVFLLLYFAYLAFLIYIWKDKGQNPSDRAIMPRYEPPKGITAAQAAYLYNKDLTDDPFNKTHDTTPNFIGISVVQMVANGFLKLTVKKIEGGASRFKNMYILEKSGKAPSNFEERLIREKKIIVGTYYNNLAYKEIRLIKALAWWVREHYTTTNRLQVMIPTALVASIMLFFLQSSIPFLLAIPIVVFVAFVYSFFTSAVFSEKLSTHIIISLFPSIFIGFYAILLWGWFVSLPIVLTSFTSYIMSFLLYRPTRRAQRLIEQLKGLRLFLETIAIPSSKATQISTTDMEKLFPYALALCLEKQYKNKCRQLFELAEDINASRNVRVNYEKEYSLD